MARLWYADRLKFGRSCLDCRRYQYDEETGRPAPDRTAARLGLPMFRAKGVDPPCHNCGKAAALPVRERHWRYVVEPPEWAYRCFAHWRECEAAGFPDADRGDPIVRANAAAFGAVREAYDESPARQTAAALTAIAAAVRLAAAVR